ncbi:MAG: O-antigen ligase family protein [Bacteroidetes bacterium]|nr:O-antigen ligase family protein [Bacteroidota bacterium]
MILFFFFWLAYGVAFFPFLPDKKIALYEIRSLIMMAAFICIVFRARYLLKAKPFFQLLNQLSLFLFILFTAVAFFEFFTGIHFSGFATEKLWKIPVVMQTYAPLFLYDNPNTALAYLFGLAILVFLSSIKSTSNTWKNLSITFILFLFSVVADSKFGKISTYLLAATWLIFFSLNKKEFFEKKYFWWTAISVLSILICVLTKPLYFGPLWKNSEHYLIPSITLASVQNDKLYFYSPDSLVKQFGEKEVIKSYREYQLRGTDWSANIRKNLLMNGWYLTKQSKFKGVGPAQFRWYHQQKTVPYPTTTVTNPHNYAMEILSQYGLAVFIPFILLCIFSWLSAFRKRNNNIQYFYLFSVCCIVFILISNMPSSFLILNIGWVLIPVFFIAPVQLEEKNA